VSYRVITSPGDDGPRHSAQTAVPLSPLPLVITVRRFTAGRLFYSRIHVDGRIRGHSGVSSRRAKRHQHSDLQSARHRHTKRPFYRPAKLARMRNARCREWKGTPDHPPSPLPDPRPLSCATGEGDRVFD